MSKPYTPADLSSQLDFDLNWRRRELSDLKSAVKAADPAARRVLLRSLVTMSYAHWEGFARNAATKYFTHLTLKKKPYQELDPQFYRNSFLVRFDALFRSRMGTQECCDFIDTILSSRPNRFSYINPQLIDTRSNLNTDVISDICIICGIDKTFFESERLFIDSILLKKRNAIAHGQEEGIEFEEMDNFVDSTLALMTQLQSLLENKIYQKGYLAP
jgi:hypothetical protein